MTFSIERCEVAIEHRHLMRHLGENSFRRGGQASGDLNFLRSFSSALSSALETLDASHDTSIPELGSGIDFYDEVRRFEIELIKKALKRTDGCQRQAATLLGLNATTLNSKIKTYDINWRRPFEDRSDGED